jgi:uncharacterized protein YvpB
MNARKAVRRHHGFLKTLIALPVFLGFAVFFLTRQPQPTFSSNLVAGRLPLDAPVVLDFSWPVSRNLEFRISPHIDGELSFESAWLREHLVTRAVFTPDFSWPANTNYEITLANIKNAIPGIQNPKIYALNFTTNELAEIKQITPGLSQVIGADAQWQVDLNQPVSRFEEYLFQFDPNVEFRISKKAGQSAYVIVPQQLLGQGRKYTLKIFQIQKKYVFSTDEIASQSEPVLLAQHAWQVKEPPGVAKVSPTGQNIGLAENLEIVFTEKLDLQVFLENVSLEPKLSGSWSSVDGKTFLFFPEDLRQETTYTVKIKAGAKTLDGGYLPDEVVYQFSTIEPVKILESQPKANALGVTVGSALRFIFNQPVDKKSAEANFGISPNVKGDFSWAENTLIFKPASALAFNTTYNVVFKKGISAPAGLASTEEHRLTFLTEVSVTRLAVPFHRQGHKLSCEVATLVMALRYRGLDIGEQPLIDFIGFDPTPKKNGVWGDPHRAFVGDINGQQPGTGYGVYWEPIAKAANQYRTARAFTKGQLTDITNEVKKGNPVIIWGTAGTGRRIDWKTRDGKNIVAITGEHTRIVIGFVGSASNPSKIITLDPLYGEKNFTQSAFLANWGLLGNSGVVVE